MPPRFLDPKNDVAFKKVFALPEHKRLLISLLNALLQREGEERIKDVEILPTELIPHTEAAKRSIFDVRCIDERNFQYIVEIQKNYMSSFIQRIQFYGAKAYTGQLGKGHDYLTLKSVIVLAILNHILFPDAISCVSYHDNVERTSQVSYMKDLSYVMVELPKFERKPGKIRDTLEGWLSYLRDAPDQVEIPEGMPSEIQEAYHIVEQYKWSLREMEAYDRALIAYMDDKDKMRTGAHEQGLQKGIQEEKLAIAHKMYAEGISEEMIEKITGLSSKILEDSKNS